MCLMEDGGKFEWCVVMICVLGAGGGEEKCESGKEGRGDASNLLMSSWWGGRTVGTRSRCKNNHHIMNERVVRAYSSRIEPTFDFSR